MIEFIKEGYMQDRIIVLNSGVDKKEMADATCCPAKIAKIAGE